MLYSVFEQMRKSDKSFIMGAVQITWHEEITIGFKSRVLDGNW